MRYVLFWGSYPSQQYEHSFNTSQEALDLLNGLDVRWNCGDGKYWYKFYEQRNLISDSMWEDMQALMVD